MLTAEFGGSGGKPIESGLVVEEPDIEIGAGVSSKGEFLSSRHWMSILIFSSYQPTHADGQERPDGPAFLTRQ
jgi:hypothetical protein